MSNDVVGRDRLVAAMS